MTATSQDAFLPKWGNKEEMVKTKYKMVLKGTWIEEGNKVKNKCWLGILFFRKDSFYLQPRLGIKFLF